MERRPGTTVDARFRAIALRFAERPAIRHRRTTTYRDLDQRSDVFAAMLKGAPVVIGVSLAQPADAIAAMLGTMKAGCAYTLIDHDASLQRKLAIVEVMALELVISDDPTGPWQGFSGRWLDPTSFAVGTSVVDERARESDAAAACCIVQTSGTSGQALGVEISHAALLNTIDNYTSFALITTDDRLTMLTSAAHFAAHSAIFGALLNGACLCVFEVRTDGFPAMADWLEQERLTIYQSPPSLFRAFCQHLSAQRKFPAVRFLRLGGEPALLSDFNNFQKHFSTHALFLNALGITEAAGNVAFFRMDTSIDLSGPVLPVGSASPGRTVFLATSTGEPVAEGEVGEIVVRSEYLATGYYRRPDLTFRKFKVATLDGRRELWTGDLGRITPEGWLMLEGRMDEQLKIRGHRVDILGLESALCSLDDVHTARVLRRQRPNEPDDLLAFVVPIDILTTSGEITRQIAAFISSPVLPRVVMLREIPLNPGGKINRVRLLELAEEAAPQPLCPGARNETEEQVAEIWTSVLGVGGVGVHEHFFESGGNSLQALSVMAALEARYAVRFSPKSFLDHPTIALMAEYLQASHVDRPTTPLVVFQGEGDAAPLFFLHNDWRGGFYCGKLASHMGALHPFCSIPPYSYAEPRMVSVQEMATAHLAVVRQQTPRGPYFLGGFCTGALVAAEMAHQLLAQGEQIAGLLLIDPPRGASPWPRLWPWVNRMGDGFKWDIRKRIDCMQLYGLASVVIWFRKSPQGMIASLCRRLGLKKLSKFFLAEPERDESDVEMSKRDDYAAYVLASRIHQLKRVSVPTTIYIPIERTPPSRSWFNHMRDRFPLASFQRIPGNHFTCIAHHGDILGLQMGNTLDVMSRMAEPLTKSCQ